MNDKKRVSMINKIDSIEEIALKGVAVSAVAAGTASVLGMTVGLFAESGDIAGYSFLGMAGSALGGAAGIGAVLGVSSLAKYIINNAYLIGCDLNGHSYKTQNYYDAKTALKNKNPQKLEKILEIEGFTEKIFPNKLSGADKYWTEVENMHVDKDGKKKEPKIKMMHPMTGGTIYEDRTNYLSPLEDGFILVNKDKTKIAAYGILKETYCHKQKKLDTPRHFFFIEDIKDDEKKNLAKIVTDTVKSFPGNPADDESFKASAAESKVYVYASGPLLGAIGSMFLDHYIPGTGMIPFGLAVAGEIAYYAHKESTKSQAKSEATSLTYGEKALKRYFKERASEEA